MRKNLISRIRQAFEKEEEKVFSVEDLTEEGEDESEVRESLKGMTEDGILYCQVAFECEDGHIALRVSGLPEHHNRDQKDGSPWCSGCESYVNTNSLEPSLTFVTSLEKRDDWTEDDED